jgi:protein phosphatase
LSNGEIDAEQARYSPERNVLERALGAVTHAQPDIVRFPRQSGDLYLLCSDGLSSQLDDDEIEHILNDPLMNSLEERCHALIRSALERGGHDNVSVILVEL